MMRAFSSRACFFSVAALCTCIDLLSGQGALAQIAGPSGGGSSVAVPQGEHQHCVTPEQRAELAAIVDRYFAAQRGAPDGVDAGGPSGGSGGPGSGLLYAFWPQAGTLGRDLATNNFVDLDTTAGIRDYGCGNWTYDGHQGHDIDLRGFGDQFVGVPIYAAADGTVIARADGNFDQNTSFNSLPANYVVLDHGGGRVAYYYHMKSGSVAVTVGQVVRAGQQIGLTGSSGNSTAPHLHFESWQSGAVIEPFAGPCRAGVTGWVNQYQPDRTTPIIRDFGFSNTTLSSFAGPPAIFPRTSHAAFSDTILYYWMQGYNMPAFGTVQFRFTRPNGTVAFASTPSVPGWANQTYRSWWAWYSWNIAEMRTIAGTWRVAVLINGQVVIDAPIEVLATRVAGFNRPPRPVSLVLDPPSPQPADVVFCRVTSSLAVDDPDYDLVRHRFVWRVDGTVVRDVISAALSDALPRNSFVSGQSLTCTVTPSDGVLSAPSSSRSRGCTSQSDVAGANQSATADGALTADDIIVYLGWFFASDPRADVSGANQSATVDWQLTADDIIVFLARYFAGC